MTDKDAIIDEILAIINPTPPEGAFTAQDVAERGDNLSNEYARQKLMDMVKKGVLETGMFQHRRYFWKVQK